MIARVALGAAVAGGAYLLLRTPALRRLVWQGARLVAFSWLPSVVAGELRAAWANSARPGETGAPSSVAVPDGSAAVPPEAGPRG
jgi:hypothetical protein